MFQASYRDTRMALTEAVLESFLLWTLDKFWIPGYREKIILFKHEASRKETPAKDFILQK